MSRILRFAALARSKLFLLLLLVMIFQAPSSSAGNERRAQQSSPARQPDDPLTKEAIEHATSIRQKKVEANNVLKSKRLEGTDDKKIVAWLKELDGCDSQANTLMGIFYDKNTSFIKRNEILSTLARYRTDASRAYTELQSYLQQPTPMGAASTNYTEVLKQPILDTGNKPKSDQEKIDEAKRAEDLKEARRRSADAKRQAQELATEILNKREKKLDWASKQISPLPKLLEERLEQYTKLEERALDKKKTTPDELSQADQVKLIGELEQIRKEFSEVAPQFDTQLNISLQELAKNTGGGAGQPRTGAQADKGTEGQLNGGRQPGTGDETQPRAQKLGIIDSTTFWSVAAIMAVSLVSCGYLGWLLCLAKREREDRTKLLEGLDTVTVSSNLDGQYLEISPKDGIKTLQLTTEQLAGLKLHNLFKESSFELVMTLFKQARKGNRPIIASALPLQLGSGLTLETLAEIRCIKKGKSERLSCRFPDLSKRISEARLQARLEALLKSMPGTALLIENSEGKIIKHNVDFRRLFSFQENAQVADSIDKIFTDAHAPLNDRSARDKIMAGDGKVGERMSLANKLLLNVNYEPVLTDGTRIGGVWAFRDLRHLEKERRALEAELARLSDTLPADTNRGAFILDSDDVFVVASKNACDFFGLKLEELVGRREKDLLAANGDSKGTERAYNRVGGGRIWAKMAKAKIPDEERYLCIFTDITTQKEPQPAQFKDLASNPDEWCPLSLREHVAPYLTGYKFQEGYHQYNQGPDGWQIVGGTRRGRSHAHEGKPRDDAFYISTSDRYAILCVSDGAGSAKLSRIASEMTCRTVGQQLADHLNTAEASLMNMSSQDLHTAIGQQMHDTAREALIALRNVAEKGGYDIRDFYATFLMTVIYVGEQATAILTNQIGDGFIAIRDAEGKSLRFGEGDSGEYSGQVSCFIPDDKAFKRLVTIRGVPDSNIQALILATDGIEDPFYPVDSRVGAIFDQFIEGSQTRFEDIKQPLLDPILGPRGNPALVEEWLKFEKRGENDDRTIVVAWRNAPVAKSIPVREGVSRVTEKQSEDLFA